MNPVCGRDSIVGIATRYGLDVSEFESRWGLDFPYPSRQVSEPPVEWVSDLFPEAKAFKAPR